MIYQCSICNQYLETLRQRTTCQECKKEVDVAIFELNPDYMPSLEDVLRGEED